MKPKKELKKLIKRQEKLEKRLRERALTMRDCTHLAEFDFHADQTDKDADKAESIKEGMIDIQPFISGSGTGDN